MDGLFQPSLKPLELAPSSIVFNLTWKHILAALLHFYKMLILLCILSCVLLTFVHVITVTWGVQRTTLQAAAPSPTVLQHEEQ